MAEVHVVPCQDLIAHEFGPEDHDDCICGPVVKFVKGGQVIVHMSLDGREFREVPVPQWIVEPPEEGEE